MIKKLDFPTNSYKRYKFYFIKTTNIYQNMEKPKDPEIDFPIDRINKFLEKHTFVVPFFEYENAFAIKIKLTGLKNFISVGEWTPYILYDIHFVPGTETQNIFASIFFGDENKEVPYLVRNKTGDFYQMSWEINKMLRSFLNYFGVEYSVTPENYYNHVPYKTKLREGLLLEGKYDSVVRKIVKDITGLLRYGQTGDFSLPDDVSGGMVYDFPQLQTKFSVEVVIEEDSSVDDYEINAEFYRDEDIIELEIIINPTQGRKIIQSLIGDLNEIIMHEITHVVQYENDYDLPEDEEGIEPLEYYTREHELEAQYKGFKRRAKSEKRPIEDVMDKWFQKNEKLHRLSPKEIEIVKNKILNYPKLRQSF